MCTNNTNSIKPLSKGGYLLSTNPEKAYLLLALQPANNIPYVAKEETANM